MKPEQVRQILDTICKEWNGKEEQAPNICILHGRGATAIIQATYPTWELDGDILKVNFLDSRHVRWLTCESIDCIGTQ